MPSYATHRNGSAFWYYARTVEGSEYSIYCRAPAADPRRPPEISDTISGEQVLLDGNAEAAGHEFFALGAFSVSIDGRLLAYSVDLTGGERFTLLIKDLATGELLPDRIEDTAYGVAWAQDSHVFYTRADEAWRPARGAAAPAGHRSGRGRDRAHRAGRAVLARRRQQPGRALGAVRAGSKLTSEYRMLSTDDPGGRAADRGTATAGR